MEIPTNWKKIDFVEDVLNQAVCENIGIFFHIFSCFLTATFAIDVNL